MALVVLGLVFRRRSRQVELAPILDPTDDTSVVENLLSGDSGDPAPELEGWSSKGGEQGTL